LMPCRLVGRYQHFGATNCLHLQPWRWTVALKYWYLPMSLHSIKTQKNKINPKDHLYSQHHENITLTYIRLVIITWHWSMQQEG
jgi:hypothetical protein